MKHTIADFERNKPDNLDFEEFRLSRGFVTKATGLLRVTNGTIRTEFDGGGRCIRPSGHPEISIIFQGY